MDDDPRQFVIDPDEEWPETDDEPEDDGHSSPTTKSLSMVVAGLLKAEGDGGCGTGAGGFKPGNTCGEEEGGGGDGAKATEEHAKAKKDYTAALLTHRQEPTAETLKELQSAKAKLADAEEKLPKKPGKGTKKPKPAVAAAGTMPEPGSPIPDDSRANKKYADKLGETLSGRTKALNLDADETKAIKNYTAISGDGGYRAVNQSLRTCGDGPDCFKTAAARNTHAGLQAAFAKAGKLPEPVTVYRGVGGQAAEAVVSEAKSALAAGKGTITAKGITSTTIHPDVAQSFQNDEHKVVMRIRAKTGIYAEGLTASGGEYELIQNHGTKYKPLSVKKHGKVTVVDLEEI